MPRLRSRIGLVSWYGRFSRALVTVGLARRQTTTLDGAAEGAHQDSQLAPDSVLLPDLQAGQIRLARVQSVQRKPMLEVPAYVDVDQDRELNLFPRFPGRILSFAVQVGDPVRQGQILYAVDCPDFVAAQNTLISAAETLQLTAAAVDHASRRMAIGASARQALEQARADYQEADAAFKAARSALDAFELGGAEVVRLIEGRQPGTALAVRSPVNGIVAARNGATGDLVQPGTAPAPLSITDLGLKWMIANPDAGSLAGLRLGQAVSVTVQAYPDRRFAAAIASIVDSPDPAGCRAAVRVEVRDPDDLLRPRMAAAFAIETGPAVTELAVPADAVVVEDDGTMTVFVTRDGRRFARRTIRTAPEHGGMRVVLSGVLAEERLAAEGALFLSLAQPPQ